MSGGEHGVRVLQVGELHHATLTSCPEDVGIPGGWGCASWVPQLGWVRVLGWEWKGPAGSS